MEISKQAMDICSRALDAGMPIPKHDHYGSILFTAPEDYIAFYDLIMPKSGTMQEGFEDIWIHHRLRAEDKAFANMPVRLIQVPWSEQTIKVQIMTKRKSFYELRESLRQVGLKLLPTLEDRLEGIERRISALEENERELRARVSKLETAAFGE